MPQPDTATSMNMIVVEDSEIDVEILRRTLKMLGATGELVHARDGQEALDLLTRQQKNNDVLSYPFFVLLDLNMPGMNGHEFLAEVRQSPAIADARVFVLSTSSSDRDISQAYRNQAAGYLVKPNNRDEFAAMLDHLNAFWQACEHPKAPEVHTA